MSQHSPYTPDTPSSEVPGRQDQLASINEHLLLMTGARLMVARPRIDYAPPGFGKTSMLAAAERLAREQHHAVTVWVTGGAQNPGVATLALRIREATAAGSSDQRDVAGLDKRSPAELTADIPRGAQLPAGRPPRSAAGGRSIPTLAEFEDLVTRAADSAVGHGHSGLVIFIDEIQSMDAPSLRTLCATWQHLALRDHGLQTAVFAAGLPGTRVVISAAAGASVANGFDYQQMGALEPRDVRIALTAPAVADGVGWDPAALDRAVEHAQGYPHAVQLIGDLAWRKAGHPDPGGVITAAHIAKAVAELAHNLEPVYQSRWNAATTVERALIAVMARLGDGPQPRAALERQLSRDISDLRESLLGKGIITAPERGKLQFSIVGFAAYVRQSEGSD